MMDWGKIVIQTSGLIGVQIVIISANWDKWQIDLGDPRIVLSVRLEIVLSCSDIRFPWIREGWVRQPSLPSSNVGTWRCWAHQS